MMKGFTLGLALMACSAYSVEHSSSYLSQYSRPTYHPVSNYGTSHSSPSYSHSHSSPKPSSSYRRRSSYSSPSYISSKASSFGNSSKASIRYDSPSKSCDLDHHSSPSHSHSSPSYSSKSHSHSSPSYPSKSHSHSSPSYPSSSHSHSAPSHGHSHAPSYSQGHAPSYSHGHAPSHSHGHAPSYGHGHAPSHSHGHAPSHSHGHYHYAQNPFQPTDSRSGWYSYNQQYAPSRIPYKPYAGIVYPISAQCDIAAGSVTGSNEAVSIQLYQAPHQPIAVKGTFTVSDAATTYAFRIRQFQSMAECTDASLGNIFNPQQYNYYYGRVDPYQDPTRGTIFSTTSVAANSGDFTQSYLLQNLQGPESIMGMSIQLFDDTTDTIVGCCTIAQTSQIASPAPHYGYAPYYAGHSHGHGHGHAPYNPSYSSSHSHGHAPYNPSYSTSHSHAPSYNTYGHGHGHGHY